jgi:transcriptional regulator with XRE-family HTH domain
MAKIKGSISDKKLAALMYQKRQHQESIAEFFGVAQSTISAWIKEGALLIAQEQLLQNQEQLIQNSETNYLKMKLDLIEQNYHEQITNLINMARALSMDQYKFHQQKQIIDVTYQNNIKDLIENK